jgi:hypothetical protein
MPGPLQSTLPCMTTMPYSVCSTLTAGGLGAFFATSSNPTVSYLDPNDRTQGIRLRFSGNIQSRPCTSSTFVEVRLLCDTVCSSLFACFVFPRSSLLSLSVCPSARSSLLSQTVTDADFEILGEYTGCLPYFYAYTPRVCPPGSPIFYPHHILSRPFLTQTSVLPPFRVLSLRRLRDAARASSQGFSCRHYLRRCLSIHLPLSIYSGSPHLCSSCVFALFLSHDCCSSAFRTRRRLSQNVRTTAVLSRLV